MARCSVHLIENCKLCSSGFAAPAPLTVLPDPETEVQAVIAQQVPLTTAQHNAALTGNYTFTPNLPNTITIPTPQPKVSDPAAANILDVAETYGRACDAVKVAEQHLTDLSIKFSRAKEELAKATEIRDAAKKELSKLVQ